MNKRAAGRKPEEKSVCVDHLFSTGVTSFDKNEYVIHQGLVYR